MPRPKARGGPRGWSLAQVAEEAGLSRGIARAAHSRGFLSSPLTSFDVVLLKVAEVSMAFPDAETTLGHLGHRDRLVVHLARAAATDPSTTPDTALVLSSDHAELTRVRPPHSAHFPAPGFPPERLWDASTTGVLVVLPLGRWIAASPMSSAPSTLTGLTYPRTPPASTPDDPFGDIEAVS